MKHSYPFLKTMIVLLSFFTINLNAQIVNTESFDGTTFVPTGWTNLLTSGTAVWTRATAGTNPTQAPHSGAGEAYFNSYNASTGVRALITPPFSLQNNTSGAAVSFWMYRDNGYSTTADLVDVYYNTSASLTGATLLGTVNRSSALSPTVAVDGWYQYSFTIPSSVTGTSVYFILNATSAYGNNIYIDDVSWTSYPPLCSGTPSTPVAAISATSGCPGAGINLSATGATNLAGIVNQWQFSSTSGGTYNDITGANSTSYPTSTTATTYYRMISTCTISSQSATTSVVSYSVVNPGPCVCTTYGSSAASSTGDEEIFGVVFGSLNTVSNCTTVTSGLGSITNRYSNYAGILTAPDVCLGAAVPFTVNVGTCGGYYTISLGIYMDLNQNGSFADAGELVYANNGGILAGNATGVVTVPVSALTGLTRMRIILSETSSVVGPTAGYTWGETEDYCVNLLPSPTIALSSNSGSICPGGSFTVSATGATSYTYNSGSSTITGSSVTLSPIANTIYTVTGTGANGCVSPLVSSATATISTLVSPTLVISPATASACPGVSSSFTVTGANTYTWIAPASNATQISVNPAVTTIYTVSGTGTNVCNGFKTVTLTVFPTPTVSVNSGSICAGKVFTLVPSGALSYTFSSGSNTVAPSTSTVYNVVGTSSNGCLSSTLTPAVSNITVAALPLVSMSGGTVCSGSAFILQPSGATNYTFVNSSNPITPTVTGSYTVIGTTSVGCVSLPVVADVTVFALPNVAVAGTPTDMVVCQNSPISLTASGASTYTWNNTFVGATFSDTPQTTGNYFVIGTDNNGCTNLTNVPYTVNPQPALSFVTSNTFLCVGNSATLTANGGVTYSWTTGASSNTVAISPTVTTVYGVTATNTLNCSKTLTMSILVNTITLGVTANTAICQGNTIDLTATGANAFTWTPGNSPFPTIQVSPNATSSYTVKGKDSKNCFHTAIITVSVNANPAVNASTSASVICAGESATLVASGANSYSWTSGSTTTNNDTLVVNPTNSFTYNYIVTGADANGCMGMDTVSVKVDKCVGINKVSAVVSEISVYPNPNNGEFVVELNNGLSKHIEISDLSGRIILISTSSDDKTTVNLNAYAKGVYYVKVQSNTKVEVIKVIKH